MFLFFSLGLVFIQYIGNKAAGVRARKALQDLKQLAQELRVAIQRCKSESAHARLVERNEILQGPSSHELDQAQGPGLPPPSSSSSFL